jgi:hypothetical protein
METIELFLIPEKMFSMTLQKCKADVILKKLNGIENQRKQIPMKTILPNIFFHCILCSQCLICGYSSSYTRMLTLDY